MADTIRIALYFYVETPNQPGVGAAMLATLRDAGVNLLAFSGFPSGRKAQIKSSSCAARAAAWVKSPAPAVDKSGTCRRPSNPTRHR